MAKPAQSKWSTQDVLELLGSKVAYERILNDAVASLRHPLRQRHAEMREHRQPAMRLRQLVTIRDWFLADQDRGPFSFHRCCLMLSLDPEAVRDRLRAEGSLRSPEDVLRDAYAQRKAPDRRLHRAA